MNKASIVCPSCETNNNANSEFCIDCGTNLSAINNINSKPSTLNDKEKQLKEYQNWKKSLPYTVSAAIFLIFIDWVTGGTPFDWSHWAVVPIILFAVIAPYFSYKLSR